MCLHAERLSCAYPSIDTLLHGKGKNAFTFRESYESDGFVFGSKEGEYCLLRIRIENSPEAPSALIDGIVDVQMVFQGGKTVNPKMAEKQTQPHLKEVIVLLEPKMLERRVTSGSSIDIAKAVKRDARFQLHVQVTLADESGTQADIAKIVSWRTVTGKTTSLWRRACAAGQRTMKRLSQIGCLAPRTVDSPHHVQNRPSVHRKHQRGGLKAELSWRTCFDSSAETNPQRLDHSG